MPNQGHISVIDIFSVIFMHSDVKGHTLFQREKYIDIDISRISFTWTILSISTKLDTKHPWVKDIQICSNEAPHLFPKGNGIEIAKKDLPHL